MQLFSGDRLPSKHHISIHRNVVPNLSILSASAALGSLDRKASSIQGMGLRLKEFFATVADDYDVVIVDTPPAQGVLLINALACSDLIIVPVQAEHLAINGLDQMVRLLDRVSQSLKCTLNTWVVPTMVDKRTHACKQALLDIRTGYRELVWSGYVPIDTQLREATRSGLPPSWFNGSARAVMVYESLVDDIEQFLVIAGADVVH